MVRKAHLWVVYDRLILNPVLSALKYFREEYEKHIETQKSCKRLHKKAKVEKI